MLGWDTDMFPNDVGLATYIMDVVLKQGGLAPGGLNFDAKVRRESTDVEDLFIGHINGMDNYARGLRAAAARYTMRIRARAGMHATSASVTSPPASSCMHNVVWTAARGARACMHTCTHSPLRYSSRSACSIARDACRINNTRIYQCS